MEKQTEKKRRKIATIIYHEETGYEERPVWFGRVYVFADSEKPLHETEICFSAMDAVGSCLKWSIDNDLIPIMQIYSGRFEKGKASYTQEEYDEFNRKYRTKA
jgi:hypothetical protein